MMEESSPAPTTALSAKVQEGPIKTERPVDPEGPSEVSTQPISVAPYANAPPASSKKTAPAIGFRQITYGRFPDYGVFRMSNLVFGWKKDDHAKKSSRGVPVKCVRHANVVKSVCWSPISHKDFMLEIALEDESVLSYHGFKEPDKQSIQRFVRHHWKLEMETTKRATRGWHWGQYDFIGANMCISINNDPAIVFDTTQLNQITSNPGKSKNELLLGFDDEEMAPVDQDLVYEVKLHVVPSVEEEDKEKKDGAVAERTTHLEYLYDSLLAKSNLTTATASNVALILDYMNLASPPGRFDIHVVRDGFKLYGKSGNFGPIPWSNVEGVYHLETKPNSYMLLALKSSLRKGQTSYKNIVIQIDDRKVREVSLNLSADGPTDQRLIEEYKLQPVIKSEEKKLIPKLIAIYGNKKPIRSAVKDPRSDTPEPMGAIDCSYKQQLGKLCFMAQSVIFVPKPPSILKHEDIAVVDFRSPSARTRLFTFRIIMKSPRGSQPIEHSMESIDRSEYDTVHKYFTDRNIKTRTGTVEEGVEASEGGERQAGDHKSAGGLLDDDSEDDEDFVDNKEAESEESEVQSEESDRGPPIEEN
eukprot:GHVH01012368.1.p1 GENE.GHVH01012368.1~~GHVH01012368.1.p1  ORF type:complete len:586 (-),score=90.33 GHVH01012368.1:192-1949(-)